MTKRNSDKIGGAWIWYELMTPEPAGAKAFYEAVVGWRIEPGTEGPIFYGHISNDDGGDTGGILPLNAEMVAGGARPGWVGYIAVADVDAAVAAILAKGGALLMPKTTIPVGSFAMVTDCCGAPFYVMTPQMPAGMAGQQSTAFSPNLPGRCSWNELHATSDTAAIDFYTSLFGWTVPDTMNMGPFGTYHFLANGDVGIGALMTKAPHIAAPGWTFYFRVPSITAAAAAVAAHGGQVVHGPQEVPGGDWILNGIDPQGAAFALVGAKGE